MRNKKKSQKIMWKKNNLEKMLVGIDYPWNIGNMKKLGDWREINSIMRKEAVVHTLNRMRGSKEAVKLRRVPEDRKNACIIHYISVKEIRIYVQIRVISIIQVPGKEW